MVLTDTQLIGRDGICQSRYLFQVEIGCLVADGVAVFPGGVAFALGGQFNIFKFNSAVLWRQDSRGGIHSLEHNFLAQRGLGCSTRAQGASLAPF